MATWEERRSGFRGIREWHMSCSVRGMIRHGSRRGITLVEVSAVTALLGLTLSGAAVFAHSQSGSDSAGRARQDAETIASAARDWQHDGDAGCPTISLLERQ